MFHPPDCQCSHLGPLALFGTADTLLIASCLLWSENWLLAYFLPLPSPIVLFSESSGLAWMTRLASSMRTIILDVCQCDQTIWYMLCLPRTEARARGAPFTHLFSFSYFTNCIESPTKSLESLLQGTGVYPDAKAIVQATKEHDPGSQCYEALQEESGEVVVLPLAKIHVERMPRACGSSAATTLSAAAAFSTAAPFSTAAAIFVHLQEQAH